MIHLRLLAPTDECGTDMEAIASVLELHGIEGPVEVRPEVWRVLVTGTPKPRPRPALSDEGQAHTKENPS